MTSPTSNNHPITPPYHLLSRWQKLIDYASSPTGVEETLIEAVHWGADEELEAYREEIVDGAGRLYIDDPKLRVRLADDIWTARRPKLPSLKERIATAIARGDNSIALALLDQALPS